MISYIFKTSEFPKYSKGFLKLVSIDMTNTFHINNPELETIILRKRKTDRPDLPPIGSKKPVSNKKDQVPTQHIAKMERNIEEGSLALPKVPLSLRLEIQKARQQKTMTQAELAAKINEPVELIKKYENGTIVPVGVILSKIKRCLQIR